MAADPSAGRFLPASDETQRALSNGIAFLIVSLGIYVAQKVLLPLEAYWLELVGALLTYSLVGQLLAARRLARNVFTAADDGSVRLADALVPLLGPPAISIVLSIVTRHWFAYLLPAVLFTCITQTCLSATLAILFAHLPGCRGSRRGACARPWLLSLGLAAMLYGLAFFSLETKKPVNPLLSTESAARGVWFTIPVERSQLFPAGFARLEDSIFDDLGRLFVGGLGQMLGMVEACEIPYPDQEPSILLSALGSSIQPKYHYAIEYMCANWIASLPGFFWRIGLLGVFFLAVVVGIGLFRDPGDFAILALVLLVGWTTWPAPAMPRMGNVAVLVVGLPMIALIPVLWRRGRYSYLVMWGVVSGLVFGLAAFVRRPCGQALILTAVGALLYAGLRHKRALLALTASLALVSGSSLVPAAVNGMFSYRDARLRISAPKIGPRVHGSWFPLLGGIGGEPSGAGPQYNNALDAAFLDAGIWYIVTDANPMIGLADKSYALMQSVSRQVLVRYALEHPVELSLNLVRKAYAALLLILDVPARWVSVPLLLFGLLSLRRLFSRQGVRTAGASASQVREVVLVLLVLALGMATPAILTSPGDAESVQLPAAVLFFALVLTCHSFLRSFIAQASQA